MRWMRGLGVVAVLVVLLAAVPAAAVHSVSHEENGLLYWLATTQDTFSMYEYVPVECVVTNVSDATMVIEHPCGGLGGISVSIWNPGTPFHPDPMVMWGCCGCFTVTWIDSLGPGETYARQMVWDMYNMYTEQLIWLDGTYTLKAEILMSSFPEHADLSCELELPFEILECPTAVPEELRASWGHIKALYQP